MKIIGSGFLAILLLIVSIFGGCAQPAPAPKPTPAPAPVQPKETAADFYKGKTMTVAIASSPGGGTDLMARIVSTWLTKKFGLTVVPKNMAGGAGLEAINYVYKTAKPDGLTIGEAPKDKIWLPWLSNEPGAEYDGSKFKYFGVLQPAEMVFVVKAGSPYTSFEALKQAKKLKFGGTVASDFMTLGCVVSAEILGLDASVIPGYKGSAGCEMALMQGEIDAFVVPEGTAFRYAEQGQISPLWVVASKRIDSLPKLPAISELKKLSESDKTLMTLYFGSGKLFFAPPDTPEDRVKFIDDSLNEIYSDKDFQKEILKADGFWANIQVSKDVQQQLSEIAKAKASFNNVLMPLNVKYGVK